MPQKASNVGVGMKEHLHVVDVPIVRGNAERRRAVLVSQVDVGTTFQKQAEDLAILCSSRNM